MSVVINSNFAATLAANNLAASNQMLQRSLNRLSSGSRIVNPADDAGGLAVSMKLSASVHREGAVVTNLGNSVSFLQTQDGVLKVAGKVIDRISELKTLAADPTKSTSDIANYNVEFTELQKQLTSLAQQTFNGVALFGSATLSVATSSEPNGNQVAVGGTDLLGVGTTNLLTENFADLSNWTVTAGSPSVSGGVLTLGNGDELRTNGSFTSPFVVTYDAKSGGAGSLLDVRTTTGAGSPDLARFDNSDVGDTNWHSVRMQVATNGSVTSYLDGSATPYDTQSGWAGGTAQIFFHAWGGVGTQIRNLQVTNPNGGTNVNTVANASSLSTVSLSTIKSSLDEVATFRAQNGAQQSRLGFATDVLTTNKANLEAANSRIVDVDVAAESTALARSNILVQAGTAMLSQANQSAQAALRLIG
jgi:flagellin